MKCRVDSCQIPATVALLIRRSRRQNLVTIIYWEIQTIPKRATLYCNVHGPGAITDMFGTRSGD
jgi:hypothetical protein